MSVDGRPRLYELERCPTCGDDPDHDALHREDCPRVGTCGQFGPPWTGPPWHLDEAVDGSRGHWLDWLAAVNDHRRDAHDLGPVAAR
jgi:hypothetical protein